MAAGGELTTIAPLREGKEGTPRGALAEATGDAIGLPPTGVRAPFIGVVSRPVGSRLSTFVIAAVRVPRRSGERSSLICSRTRRRSSSFVGSACRAGCSSTSARMLPAVSDSKRRRATGIDSDAVSSAMNVALHAGCAPIDPNGASTVSRRRAHPGTLAVASTTTAGGLACASAHIEEGEKSDRLGLRVTGRVSGAGNGEPTDAGSTARSTFLRVASCVEWRSRRMIRASPCGIIMHPSSRREERRLATSRHERTARRRARRQREARNENIAHESATCN
jgi:hypothetical protein